MANGLLVFICVSYARFVFRPRVSIAKSTLCPNNDYVITKLHFVQTMTKCPLNPQAEPGPSHRRVPLLFNLGVCVNFDDIHILFIVVYMQCLQYVYYALLSIQISRVYVKRISTEPGLHSGSATETCIVFRQ